MLMLRTPSVLCLLWHAAVILTVAIAVNATVPTDINFVKARAPLITIDVPLVPTSYNGKQYHNVQSLFPDIRFTCSGTVSEWTVIAYYEEFVNVNNPLPYVLLELWRTSDGSNYTLVDPMKDGIARSPLSDVLPENNSMPQIFTQRMDPPLHFEAGDVLGVYNPYRGDSHAFLGYLSDRGPKNYAMSGLHSRDKYPDPPIVMNVERNLVEGQYNYPLVSPNASPSNCAEGFLSKEQLRSIIADISIATHTGPTPVSMCYAQLYFTCAGSINKILFAGKQTTALSTTQWPELQLYSCDNVGKDLSSCDPVPKATIPLNNTQKTSLFDIVYEQTLDPTVEFDANDRIGLYQPAQGASQVEVYFEEGALLESFDNNAVNCTNTTDIPLVAIETDSLTDECVGSPFLAKDELSFKVALLETIVPIENQLRIIPDLMFEADGYITRWIVATIDAFPFEDKPDYPDIQVWRAFEESSSEFTLVHSTSGLSPSLTDDTNLYAYVLDEPWPVMAGDFIGMYVPDKEMARLFIYSTERSAGPTNYYFLNAQSTQKTFDTSLNPFTSTSIPLVFADFIQELPTSTRTTSIETTTDTIVTESSFATIVQTGTPTASPEDDTRYSLTSGLVSTAIILVLLLLLAASVATLLCLLLRRKKRNVMLQEHDHRVQVTNPVYNGLQIQHVENGGTVKSSAYDYAEPVAILYQNLVPTAEERTRYDSVASIASRSFMASSKIDTIREKMFVEKGRFWEPGSDPNEIYDQMAESQFLEIPRDLVKTGALLGSGEFGVVNKGKWDTGGGEITVAVKVLKDNSFEAQTKFLQEAAIIGQFHHANIIRLCGVVTVGKPMMMVLEYMNDGSLKDFLPRKKSTGIAPDLPKLLLSFCYQVASGGKYFSEMGFVHRDIAARNVLVSKGTICKIADFGMSRDLDDDNYYLSSGGRVPVKWSAPEAMNFKKYSGASDVWSYGVLMFEIWSLGQKPFKGFNNTTVIHMTECGYRQSPPPGCPRAIYEMMVDCWHPEKDMRPTFDKLKTTLSELGDAALLAWSEEDRAVHPQASELGAPLDAGKALYPKLQNMYLAS